MTDEASTILTAVQGILQGMTRFTDDQVTDGDYRVMSSGLNECAVLTVGAFSQEADSQNREFWTHTILIDLFERDQMDGLAWANFRAMRGDVLETLRKYPQLNASTLLVESYDLSSEADPAKVKDTANGGPYFIAQTVRARYTIWVDVTGGDTGY